MKLYLMRHCESTEGDRMDAKRPLTDEGLHQAKIMKRFRKSAGIKWDVVFSSDFERATTTATVVKNRKAPCYMLKELRPLGTAEEAFAAIRRVIEIDDWQNNTLDEMRVLVVTHDPLINKLAAAVCFGFSPDINNFSHGTMMRIDTHKTPPDKHPLHWLVRPSLIEGLEDGELVEAAVNLSENLRQTAKARVVDPLISKLHKAVARRFRGQARGYKANGYMAGGTIAPIFDRVTYDAYIAGAAMVHAQIGKFKAEEVEYNDPRQPHVRLFTEAKKKPLLPVAIATALSTYERTGADLEREIDATSAEKIAAFIATLSATRDVTNTDVAKLIASWAKDRAQTIADYEVKKPFHAGGAAVAELIAQQPGTIVEKSWNTNGDACEKCEANQSEGWIPEDILFETGMDFAPGHLHCDCDMSYRKSGGGE